MPTYAPTVTPGDQRRRTRYIGIRVPHDGVPTVEILEQEVIRAKAGERVLEDLNGFGVAMDEKEMAASFQVRDPITDAEIPGATATGAQVFALIYSWVRAKQLARDAAAAAKKE
jgi:hypothetical protein